MHVLRTIARWFSSLAFRVLILLLAVVGTSVIAIHSPTVIKRTLKDSGIYDTFVSNLIDELKKGNQNNPEGINVSFEDPQIQKLIKDTFTPQLLQNSTENFIDGTYHWLDGKTKVPDFKIDLTSTRNTFAVLLADRGISRLKTLKPCTVAQLKSIDVKKIDPFNIPCLPPGIDLKLEQKELEKQVLDNNKFLPNPVITANTLSKNDQGKTVFDQLSLAPKIFKWADISIWLLGGLAVLFGAALVFLHNSRRRGLKVVGLALETTGLILVLGLAVSTWLLAKAKAPNGFLAKAQTGSFQPTIIAASSSIQNSLNKIMVWFILAYFLVGTGILFALYMTRDKNKLKDDKDSPESKDQTKSEQKPAGKSPEITQEKPKPAAPPKKIQG